MANRMPNRKLTTFTRVVLLIAFYFVGGLVGKESTFLSDSMVLVWPPTGIALAAILLFGYRFWSGVALGAVLFSFMNGLPLGFFTLGTAIGNTVGAIVCAYLLKRFTAFDNAMERTRDVTNYIGLACFIGATVNAAFNVVSLAYGGAVAWDEMASTTLVWWVPNALAGLVVAPFILTWAAPSATRWNARLIAEAVVCTAGLVGGTLISFNSWFVCGIQNYPLAYLPFPFLVWGALRFGPRGATAGTLLVSVLAIYSLLHHIGPFVTNTESDSLMLMGSYIGILAVTNLLLAAAAAERRAAEQSVSDSEKRYRAVVEDQTDMICRFRPDGLLTFVNEAFCRFHGKRSAELVGTNFFQILAAEDAATPLSYINSFLVGSPIVSFEYRQHSSDDQMVWHQYRVRRLFQEQGDTREFQAVIQDITVRKRLEAQLFQSQKLETVGKLAGGVAHEFNSILTAIIGQTELMLGDLPAGSPLAGNALEISKSADRAAALTRQLLAYGRKQILQPRVLDLNSVLAGMENTLIHLMGPGTDVRIIPATGLHAVKVDVGQIEQVILNLVMNAAAAMPGGGKLTLETANVTLDSEYARQFPDLKAGEYMRLAITDSGTGMSEEVKARVFEPFFTTKGVGEGTGLGLSTCYGIVKQSGGHINVYTEAGRGTTFKIYLPQVESPVPPPSPRPVPAGLPQVESPVPPPAPPPVSTDLPRGTETILLVEDNPALREMIVALLNRLGYTILAAANGVEALSLMSRRELGLMDLLFTDLVMPQMGGHELAGRVSVLYPHTRILFTSGYTENAMKHQGVLHPGVALLQKPFTPSALARKLREVLDQPESQSPYLASHPSAGAESKS